MTTSRDLDKRAQERATNEGMPEAQDRERREFAGETVDKQKALEIIDAILTALERLEQALEHNSAREMDIELNTARIELYELREMVERLEDEDN